MQLNEFQKGMLNVMMDKSIHLSTKFVDKFFINTNIELINKIQ